MTATLPSEEELREVAGDDEGGNALVDLFTKTRAEVEAAYRPVEWAEDEIQQAQARHPENADRIYHSFNLLWPLPGFKFPDQEWFWRGHFRELLERAGRGDDLRPATDAEICLLMSRASLAAPLRTAAFGMYVRCWCRAFPDIQIGIGSMHGELAHYEKMHGVEMDDFEREARTAVARRNDRRIPKGFTCPGMHYGEPAPDCPYLEHDARPPAAKSRPRKGADPAARARRKARARYDQAAPAPAGAATLDPDIAAWFAELGGTPAD